MSTGIADFSRTYPQSQYSVLFGMSHGEAAIVMAGQGVVDILEFLNKGRGIIYPAYDVIQVRPGWGHRSSGRLARHERLNSCCYQSLEVRSVIGGVRTY